MDISKFINRHYLIFYVRSAILCVLPVLITLKIVSVVIVQNNILMIPKLDSIFVKIVDPLAIHALIELDAPVVLMATIFSHHKVASAWFA